MSRNLVELVRRHHAVQAPTALEVLKDAVARNGELTDEDRRRAAELSGLPEAAVFGVSTFYDDLLHAARRAPHPRLHRDGVLRRDRRRARRPAPRAASALALGSAPATAPSRSPRPCASASATPPPPSATATRSTPAPMCVERVLAGETRAAAEPRWESVLDEPVLTQPGDWSGLIHAREHLSPEELLAEVKAATVRGRGGAGFPAGQKWQFTRDAPGEQKFIVANGDEGDPGSYIDKYLMEQAPALVLEGMALAGYAVGASHGFVLTRSEYPRSKPALEEAADEARRQGMLGD